MIKKIIPVLIIVVLVGIVAIRFISQSLAEEPEVPATPVRVGGPLLGDISMRLSYNGNLRPERTTMVMPLVSGEILDIPVGRNQLVEKGQLLASLDDEVVRLQAEQARANWAAADAQLRKARQGARPEELESAQASLSQAGTELETARSNLERTRNLFEAGTISRSEYENARNAVSAAETELENARRTVRLMEEGARPEDIEMAQAQADAARQQLELAQLQIEYASITSPVDGRIIDIYSDEGNTAAPGNPLMAIVSDDLIYARIAIPEKHYGLFRTRQDDINALISPIAYPDNPPFPGYITSIAEVINAGSRTFEVDVAVDNIGSLLKPGMFVTVDFLMSELTDVVKVPNSAIVYRDGQPVVFLYNEDGTVSLRNVDPGMSDGLASEIRSGISIDDQIVVEGNSFLEDGQQVRPVQ